MKRIIYVLLCIIYFFPGISQAQDPAFSQFFASPLTLNPALTGKFSGSVRVAGNYRNQWPQINNAFITSTISVDGNILTNKITNGDAWGIGLMTMTDRTANGILTSNYVSISTSYQKALDENGWNQIGIGFQGSYASKRLDGTKLNFEDQLDQQGGWSLTQFGAVSGHQVNLSYFDLNVGVLYNGSSAMEITTTILAHLHIIFCNPQNHLRGIVCIYTASPFYPAWRLLIPVIPVE